MGLRASKPRDAANNATTGTNQQQTPGGLRVRLLPFFLSSSFKSLSKTKEHLPREKKKLLLLLLLLLLLCTDASSSSSSSLLYRAHS
jgi:hypothetical protein